MKTRLYHGLTSLLGITLIGLGAASSEAQVFSSNGQAGVYVQGNGQGMAGTFDGNGFHGIAVGPDGRVRRIEGDAASPFAKSDRAGIGVGGVSGNGAFAAAGPIPANPGGFDPFAFVFGNASPLAGGSVAAVAGRQPGQELTAARRAFRQGRYEDAVRIADRIGQAGGEVIEAEQLRGLARFALQDYLSAAEDAYTVLDSQAAWDWPTLRQMYPDRETYVQQLRALQAAAGKADAPAAVHFLLAYHYLMLDHTDAARDQLIQTQQLQPENRVVQRLLASLPPSVEIP